MYYTYVKLAHFRFEPLQNCTHQKLLIFFSFFVGHHKNIKYFYAFIIYVAII